jgi:hypothetical protein
MASSGRTPVAQSGPPVVWQNVDRSRAGFGLKGGVMQTLVGLLTRGDLASLFSSSLKVASRPITKRVRKPIK